MSRKMKLDFTGVENFQRANVGKHVCKIVSADEKQSQGGNDMIVVAFEVTKGDDKGARVYENYPLIDTALWKLKGLLQAIGMKADGKVQLDLDKLIGKICEVNVIHEEYEGRIRARVESTAKLSAAAADDDDEDDEDEAEDEEEQDEEEKPAKKPEKSKKAPMNKPEPEEDEDDDWDEEDDEEEEEKPKKGKKPEPKKEKKPEKKGKKSKDEDDDDWDDDDWDE